MSRHRFFAVSALVEVSGVAAVPLSASDMHHALHVLRLKPGEEIVVVGPDGGASIVEVLSADVGGLTGRIAGELPRQLEPHITLVQGIVKGSVMDDIVQHAVELGAERIVPLLTARTVVRLDEKKAAARTVRWQRIAEGAARQSQRARLPVVEPVARIEDARPIFAANDIAVVLWEEADAESLSGVLAANGISSERPVACIALVVGPEGGFSADEIAGLVEAGAVMASLGPAILRAETAALVAMTLASQALGALEPARAR
jgi:16S rRNA (uracil1498-N3)-methyltransferase